MSERTFLRRFGEMTGVTPAEWLLLARLDHARQLLETGGLGIEDVATAAGFGTSATMRMHFRAKVGISPREYRRRFGRQQVSPATVSGRSDARAA
jgi:AraC family transcriptional regulator, transcriptional activator FtrA